MVHAQEGAAPALPCRRPRARPHLPAGHPRRGGPPHGLGHRHLRARDRGVRRPRGHGDRPPPLPRRQPPPAGPGRRAEPARPRPHRDRHRPRLRHAPRGRTRLVRTGRRLGPVRDAPRHPGTRGPRTRGLPGRGDAPPDAPRHLGPHPRHHPARPPRRLGPRLRTGRTGPRPPRPRRPPHPRAPGGPRAPPPLPRQPRRPAGRPPSRHGRTGVGRRLPLRRGPRALDAHHPHHY